MIIEWIGQLFRTKDSPGWVGFGTPLDGGFPFGGGESPTTTVVDPPELLRSELERARRYEHDLSIVVLETHPLIRQWDLGSTNGEATHSSNGSSSGNAVNGNGTPQGIAASYGSAANGNGVANGASGPKDASSNGNGTAPSTPAVHGNGNGTAKDVGATAVTGNGAPAANGNGVSANGSANGSGTKATPKSRPAATNGRKQPPRGAPPQIISLLAATALREVLRESDVLCFQATRNRFVLALAESDSDEAAGALRRIRLLLAERLGLSVAAAIARFPQDALTLPDLIATATERLDATLEDQLPAQDGGNAPPNRIEAITRQSTSESSSS